MKKRLSDLLKGLEYTLVSGDPDETEVVAVTDDSRAVTVGTLFLCVRGEKTDGHRFAGEAVRRGANALVGEEIVNAPANVTQVLVKDSRTATALIAANFYGHPSQHIDVVGVTGTNGKTSTAFVLQKLLKKQGVRAGLLGTIVYDLPEGTQTASLTTPSALQLQKFLYSYVQHRYQVVVMEVSSHSLVQKRVYGVKFKYALFTNLSQDHLDYHPDMESYFQAKRLLFEYVGNEGKRFVNIDDPYGQRLQKEFDSVVTFGQHPSADFQATEIELSLSQTRYFLQSKKGRYEVRTSLLGIPGVYNTLAALSIFNEYGELAGGIEALPEISAPPGRFENVSPDPDYAIIVDYAHTPDALEKVLSSIRTLNPRRVITVFGCGGDRDRGGKRPLMARAAETYSDIVIVTQDNPRTESPQQIIKDILQGFKNLSSVRVIEDRREAIFEGLKLLERGDILLIAGKGHEDYQIIGTEKRPFSDQKVVKEFFSGSGNRP